MDLTEKEKHRFTIKNRFKQFLIFAGLKSDAEGKPVGITSYEDKIGASRKSIYNVINLGVFPSYETLYAIMNDHPDVNLEWLLFGMGTMIKETSSDGKYDISSDIETTFQAKNYKAEAEMWKNKYIMCMETKLGL